MGDCDPSEVVIEPPILSCTGGKPIELVFEYTGLGCEANPANPQGGKFTCSGNPAGAEPVQLVVEDANADPSTETINIGDFVSITPSGDKFDSQTDFEIIQGGSALQDLSMHLSCSQDLNVGDRFGSLILRVFVPGTDSGGMGGMGGMGGGGGGVEAVVAVFKEIKGKEFKFDIDNTGGTDVTIVRITTLWPTGVNGVLTEIKRGKSKIYDTDTPVSPAAITTWIDTESKRLIKNGEKKEFKLKFKNDADTNLGNYSVEIEFDTGTIVTIS